MAKLVSLGVTSFAAALLLSNAVLAAPTIYKDMCEASAAIAIDGENFAVGSDELNELRIYHRGAEHALKTVAVTSFDKSDIEGAANLGGTIFWISSMSLNKDGEDKPKRKVLFATVSNGTATAPSLTPTGKIYKDLRDPLLAALQQIKPDATTRDVNVEGLATGLDDSLLIGFRAPAVGDAADAIVVRLTNPVELIKDNPPAPAFDAPLRLNLDGRGIRSFEQIGTAAQPRYLIVAGPRPDEGHFAFYDWDGVSADPDQIPMDFEGIKPEAMFATGNGTLQFLGDNGGDDCDEEKLATAASWWFPSIERPLP